MHSSYFVLKNKEGKQAEQIVKDYLTDRGYTVQDVKNRIITKMTLTLLCRKTDAQAKLKSS